MTSNPENKYLSRLYAATDFSFPYVLDDNDIGELNDSLVGS
jgi:hypothetical protein